MNFEPVSIVIPVHNGERTLHEALNSLRTQENKHLVQKLIIINDGSSDRSLKVIKEFERASPFQVELINHDKARGLSASYNEAIINASTKFIITMHQDIILNKVTSITDAITPMLQNGVIAATYPTIIHHQSLWETYNFWQKCLFSRYVTRQASALTGKFDAFRVESLKKVGLFDSEHFRTAGEDADIRLKLERQRGFTVDSKVIIQHAEAANPTFSYKSWAHKEAQYAEARGALLRRHGPEGLISFLVLFFREALIVGLLIPYFRYLDILIIAIYSWRYTKAVYDYERKDPRVWALPFINIWLLVLNSFYSALGFIRGRQTI